tara:strand:+ start:104 stop:316 length:213 start_codon:yes stop_codon:yes gene_type:complete
METLGNMTIEQLIAKARRADEIKEQRKKYVYKYRETHKEQEAERARNYSKKYYHQKKEREALEKAAIQEL